MNIYPWLILLLIHLILSVIWLVLIIGKKVSLRNENIFPIFLVPIFGPLAAFIIEWVHRSGKEAVDLDLLMPLIEDEDIIWNTIKHDQESGDIIPLEEALLIDEPAIRRSMMLKALYDDPLKYLDVLRVAAHNNDVETAHYATTTISNEQRKFQLQIQKASAAYISHPENEELLNKYIHQIEQFIKSGLLEEYLLHNQRIEYSRALEKKIELTNSEKQPLIKLLRNSIELNQYGTALEITEQLKEK